MKLALAITAFFVSINAFSATWITASGKVESIVTYAHTETILVNITTSGTDVAECSNKKTFAISSNVSAEGRARMYSMLLSAQATDRTVTLSFLDVGGCESWFSTQNVYRRIARLQ